MARNVFNTVQVPAIGSSNFDLSYDHKTTLDMGNLVPFHVQECVPGDKFRIQSEAMLRFAPLVAPVMHRINVFTHYFFVPNRLTWSGWEDWIANKGEPVAFPTMYMDDDPSRATRLTDYMGIPKLTRAYNVSALPFAAYQMIYNEFYRDQNLVEPVDYKLVDGSQPFDSPLYQLRKRAWMHDYFTAALPFAQKGEDVTIPIGNFSDVDVYLKEKEYPGYGDDEPQVFRPYDNSAPADNHGDFIGIPANESGSPEGSFGQFDGDTSVKRGANLDPNGTLAAETSSLTAEAASIRDLRRAFKLQEWLERNARGGTRYVESVLSHFGVKSSDARLNRPEFLGGSKKPVIISEVLQTSETTDSGTPQATMAGHGISVGSGKPVSYYCEEHGYIIGIMSVMPVTAYQQGVPRHFLKNDPLMYYWPSFQHIGEQEVINVELYADYPDGPESDIGGTFGYVPRYVEYKYNPSRVSGDFKNSLDFWHLGRIFSAPPALNQDFIECNPGKRIFAVTDDDVDSIYCHVFLDIKARRKMSKYGNPSF